MTRRTVRKVGQPDNRNTVDRYNQIGLPEYFAMEVFVRCNG